MEIQLNKKQILVAGLLILFLLVAVGALGWVSGRRCSRPAPEAATDTRNVPEAKAPASPKLLVEQPAGADAQPEAPPVPEKETVLAQDAAGQPQPVPDSEQKQTQTQTDKTLTGQAAPAAGTQSPSSTGKGDGADTQKAAPDSATNQKAPAETKGEGASDSPEPKAGTAPETAATMAYSVQVGTFVAPSAAQALVESLAPFGFSAEILYGHNQRGREYYIVQIGAFDNYTAADAAVKDLLAKADKVAVVQPLAPYTLAQMKEPPQEAAEEKAPGPAAETAAGTKGSADTGKTQSDNPAIKPDPVPGSKTRL